MDFRVSPGRRLPACGQPGCSLFLERSYLDWVVNVLRPYIQGTAILIDVNYVQ